MTWLRRLRRDPADSVGMDEGAAAPALAFEPVTTFTGFRDFTVASDLEDGLYECFTERGEHIVLHDMEFRGFRYTATRSPQLAVRFEWGADFPMPKGADVHAGPVVEFRFGDVRIAEWEEEFDERDRAHLGQVGEFSFDRGWFTLGTYTVSLRFRASTCTVVSGSVS